jgi:hypothetical protein
VAALKASIEGIDNQHSPEIGSLGQRGDMLNRIIVIFIFLFTQLLQAQTLIFSPPSDTKPLGTIVAFHGGCFTGGNTTWDKQQNEALVREGFRVIQVEFPKQWTKFQQWVQDELPDLVPMDAPIFLLGRSSGGFLAKYIHDHPPSSWENLKAIYICPVFRPYIRAELLPKFRKRTDQFFDTPPNSTEAWDPQTERLYLAKEDGNVPTGVFTQVQLENGYFFGPKTHKGMTISASKPFCEEIRNWFISPKSNKKRRLK